MQLPTISPGVSRAAAYFNPIPAVKNTLKAIWGVFVFCIGAMVEGVRRRSGHFDPFLMEQPKTIGSELMKSGLHFMSKVKPKEAVAGAIILTVLAVLAAKTLHWAMNRNCGRTNAIYVKIA